MKKWQTSIILLELIYGIGLLILSITNDIHSLFDSIVKNQILVLGLFFIVVAPITLLFIKKYNPQATHPSAQRYGIVVLIVGIIGFIWYLTRNLSLDTIIGAAPGYLIFGLLILIFNILLGSILIMESFKAKRASMDNDFTLHK